MKTLRQLNPELARSYDTYTECRGQQLFTAELPKGKSTSVRIVTYTTGIANLPEAGGLLDQPYRLMSLFNYFLSGDRMATMKDLS